MKTLAQKRKLAKAAVQLGLVIPDIGVMYRNQAATLCGSFTKDQMAYVSERASAHGITSSDVLNMMDPEVAQCPHAAIAKLKDSELSHIISQDNAPHLADDPSNIVLEPADGFNQARGANDMTVSDRLHVEMRSEAQDASILDHAHHNASFEDVWNLFGDITRNVCRGVFAFQYVEKSTWTKTIKLGQEIINDFPNLHNPAKRQAALDRLAEHIDYCAGRADCHTAFLMALLLIHAPWASALLAAKGLCTLARMAMSVARQWVDHIFGNQRLAWARRLFHGCIDFVDNALTLFLNALELAWNAVESAVKYVADVVSKTYRMASDFIQNIWNGLGSLFSWSQLKAA
jgi:hypothetical protein